MPNFTRPYFRIREGDYGFATRLDTLAAIRVFFLKSKEMQEIDRDFSQFLLETLKKKDYSSDRPVITFWDLPVEIRKKVIRLISDLCGTISLATTKKYNFQPTSILLYYNTYYDAPDEDFFSVIIGYEDYPSPVNLLSYPVALSANQHEISFLLLRDKDIHLSGEEYEKFDSYHALSAPLINFNDKVIRNILEYCNTMGDVYIEPSGGPDGFYDYDDPNDPIHDNEFNNPNNRDYDGYGFWFEYKTPADQYLKQDKRITEGGA